MLIDTEEYIKTLAAYQITPNQLLMLKLLDDEDLPNIRLHKELIGGFNQRDVDILLEKELIIRNTGAGYSINIDLTINNTNLDELPEEIWRQYPSWLLIDVHRISAKSADYDWFSDYYIRKVIKGSKRKHRKILQIINKYKSENGGYATMGIEKFFKSRHYEELDKGNINKESTTQYGSEQF